MSDLVLVLRERISEVAAGWIEIPTDVLFDARKRKGLSYEAMARQLNVASKTWERYEKAGRVPAGLLQSIAKILDLEIEAPARVSITHDADEPTLREIQGQLLALREDFERLLRLLGEDPGSAQADAQ